MEEVSRYGAYKGKSDYPPENAKYANILNVYCLAHMHL